MINDPDTTHRTRIAITMDNEFDNNTKRFDYITNPPVVSKMVD
jgi:hypothetical protein